MFLLVSDPETLHASSRAHGDGIGQAGVDLGRNVQPPLGGDEGIFHNGVGGVVG